LRDGFTDSEGYFNGLFATPMVFTFNTRLVDPKEAPASFEDLANPKWSGKMGIDAESFDWLAALLDYYGEEKGAALAARIGKQKLTVRRGEALLTQLVSAGEFAVHIDAYHHEAIVKKKAGAPIDFNFPQPFVPVKSPAAIYLSSHPPHPYAGALLVDFLLSKKGQEIMLNQNRWVGHRNVIAKGSEEIGERKTVVPSPQKWGDRYNELIALYNKLLLQK
jgi:iron(III) transport system substrate-binding protein